MTTKVSQRRARRASLVALGALEGADHAGADLERVGERLQAGRVARPVVVAEVAVRRAGGDDQVVVRQDACRRRRRASTVRAAASIAATSASRIVRLPRCSRLRSTWRIGAVTAGALSPAVATW